MTKPSFNPYGAVDLSSLASGPAARAPGATPGPAGQAAGPAATGVVVDVAEADFQAAVIDTSMTVPVVIDFWAEWCAPCKQLSPVLEKLAAQDAGRWLLAKVDLDSNPALAQAFQVQGIPAVFAVVKGQPIPLFQGALPEAKVREYVDELLRISEENGVNGRIDVGGEPEPVEEEPTVHPGYDLAYEALERGDFDAAEAAYRSVLAAAPGDVDAMAGIGQVELQRRTHLLDDAAVRKAAAANPDDVQAQCDAADLDLLRDRAEAAFERLTDLVRRTSGEDRNRARTHLVGLFELLGSQDERVAKARTALANALF